jgi:hypothetical protein
MYWLQDKYTIYVHCRKIYNLFVRTLETGRKTDLWRAFLSCFAAETWVILIVFNCVICDVSAYTVTVSFCRFTWIRYQNALFSPWLTITEVYFTSFDILYYASVHIFCMKININQMTFYRLQFKLWILGNSFNLGEIDFKRHIAPHNFYGLNLSGFNVFIYRCSRHMNIYLPDERNA